MAAPESVFPPTVDPRGHEPSAGIEVERGDHCLAQEMFVGLSLKCGPCRGFASGGESHESFIVGGFRPVRVVARSAGGEFGEDGGGVRDVDEGGDEGDVVGASGEG